MKLRSFALAAAFCFAIVGRTQAVITNWTVQSASSSLTMSGNLSTGGIFLASLEQQGSGSLTTTYGGTIETTQNLTGGVPTDIAFNSANLVANNSGSWDPIINDFPSTGPANYGALIDLEFLGVALLAYREIELGLSGTAVPLSGTPFSPQGFLSNLEGVITSGTIAYRQTGPIGVPLVNLTEPAALIGKSDTFSSAGSITYGPGGEGGVATLTIPIELNFAFLVAGSDTTTTADDIGVYHTFTGQIVATAPTASVPEANSLLLLGLAGSIVGFVGYQRTRKQVTN